MCTQIHTHSPPLTKQEHTHLQHTRKSSYKREHKTAIMLQQNHSLCRDSRVVSNTSLKADTYGRACVLLHLLALLWYRCLNIDLKYKGWFLVLTTTSGLPEIMSSIGNYQNLAPIFFKSLNHVQEKKKIGFTKSKSSMTSKKSAFFFCGFRCLRTVRCVFVNCSQVYSELPVRSARADFQESKT